MDKQDIIFLGKRLAELRKINNCNSMEEMAAKINVANKSSISRVESGATTEKTIKEFVDRYCEAFHLTDVQKSQLLRGGKIVVPDTSALLINSNIINELNVEYSRVVIPKVVIDELTAIKNKDPGSLGKRAREVISSIKYGDRIISMDADDSSKADNNDCKIIYVAEKASELYDAKVDILTCDSDYTAYLKKDETSINALYYREYMAMKQPLMINMDRVLRINEYFADSYEDAEAPASKEEANAYMSDGNTLIISAIRNAKVPVEQRKAKVKWLIKHGADVDRRACGGRFLPALSQAIQMSDYQGGKELFKFLLTECNANPNVGSRNPIGSGKVRQKNEGNMPLMIAAWHGKRDIVKILCDDERTSLNQQDENGFTALIKACANGYLECKDIIINAGADVKITDINGHNYEWHIDQYHDYGPLKDRGLNKKNKSTPYKGKKY